MEVQDRSEIELELAAAILLLWILFDGSRSRSSMSDAYRTFTGGFDRLIRPLITQIYGRARTAVADQFGHKYPVKPATEGAPTVLIPGLNRRVEQYREDLYRRFEGRWSSDYQKKEAGEEPKEFGESDAERDAVTSTTEIHSVGEMDGGKDVESRTGKRLIAVWRVYPGACPICAPLDGTTREWRTVFPGGPPGHPNCRCALEWREFLG